MIHIFYTSRSAIERYQSCPRARYWEYLYKGIGIRPKGSNLYLSTGSAVHNGIENLLKCSLVSTSAPNINAAVGLSLDWYKKEVSTLTGPGTSTPAQQTYTLQEQTALIEAQIRAWGLIELPRLLSRFRIYSVEKEVSFELSPGVVCQSRVDALLQDKDGKDIYNYSLKTCKDFNWQLEKSYKTDLQGVMELYASEQDLKATNKDLDNCSFAAARLGEPKLGKWFKSKKGPSKVSAVKFCYLVKGKREKDKKDEIWKTSNSLIKGYQKFSPSGVGYAHSYYFANPANDSGRGRLGKGWESFDVWNNKEIGGVKGWIEMLAAGKVQPDEGDAIGKWVVTPVEYFRNQGEIESSLRQVIHQEERIQNIVEGVYSGSEQTMLDTYFPQYKRSCFFPQDCDFVPICHHQAQYTGEPVPEGIEEDPVGSGYFEWRVPHHELEARQVKDRLIQIEGVRK